MQRQKNAADLAKCKRTSSKMLNTLKDKKKATDNLGYPALANAINAYISNRQIRQG